MSKSRGGNPAWVKGCPSPNPNGRPRTGLACAEKVRELVDPAEWVAFELAVARDPKMPLDRRAAAWHALIDRGFTKPAQGVDLLVAGSAGAVTRDWSALPLDERRALLERLSLPATSEDGET